MDLTQTFEHYGWTIKYQLFDPSNSSSTALPTIVFVHGTPWASDVFFPLARALLATKRFRILLYDLPGYGRSQSYLPAPTSSTSTSTSTKFPGTTSVSSQSTTLASLLTHLSITTPHVIAHDIAGTIALRTHLLHSVPFASLCLLDTNCVLPWGDGFYKLVRSEPDAFLKLPGGVFESVLRGVVRSASADPRKLDAGWEDVLAKPWLGTGTGEAEERQMSFVRQIAQADDADVAEMLDAEMYAQVQCDVKILWGEKDQWIPGEKMEKLKGLLGSRCKEFVTVPEAGHLVMLDQPERVAVEIFGWLMKVT